MEPYHEGGLGLSEYERRTLAELEASLLGSDPGFGQRMAGHRTLPPWAPLAGCAMVAVGAVVAVVTFAARLWLGAAALALMGLGLGLVLPSVDVSRFLGERAEDPTPIEEPPPSDAPV